MITLYAFGPAFGLPDPSPFVMKTEVLLKMAGLPYRTDTKGFSKAPKGKLPYLRDGEEIIADSTFIRFHLEKRYNIDFDKGLSPRERGLAWAVEKMCEDHLYWLLMYARWADDANFKRGPATFFDVAPAPIRPFVKRLIRRRVRQTLHGQGADRYTEGERTILAERIFASLSAILGDQPYIMGDQPCGADASVFAFVLGALCPVFDTGMRTSAEMYANLKDYCARLTRQYYPDHIEQPAST
jgi:glutathione S-transferase